MIFCLFGREKRWQKTRRIFIAHSVTIEVTMKLTFFACIFVFSSCDSCDSSSSVVFKRKSLITDLAFFENHWWLTKRNKQEERVLVMFSVDNSNRWFFILCASLQTAFGESLKANAVEKLARLFLLIETPIFRRHPKTKIISRIQSLERKFLGSELQFRFVFLPVPSLSRSINKWKVAS